MSLLRTPRTTRSVPASRGRGVAAVMAALTVAHVADARRLRRRAAVLPHLDRARPEPAPAVAAGGSPEDVIVVHAVGTTVPDAVVTAAAAHLDAAGLDVVDLVPATIDGQELVSLLRRVDPDRLTDRLFEAPGGAAVALVVRAEVAERLAIRAGTCTRAELLATTRTAQRGAPGRCGLVVAPDVAMPADDHASRWALRQGGHAFARPYLELAPLHLAGELLHRAALVVGVRRAPAAGLLAGASWAALPALATTGTPLARPIRDRVVGAVRRSVEEGPRLAGAARAAARASTVWGRPSGAALSLRSTWADRIADAVAHPEALVEARRDRCPWCASSDLVVHHRTGDLLQHKPGTFTLERCSTCGHTFQNPMLSLDGLDLYYDEFYDGLGAELLEMVFTSAAAQYAQRIDAVARHHRPTAWLDVGAGHGHFCLAARRRWPDATFDGLDISDSIEDAERRGWVDAGIRGLFPDLAGSLPRSYDVVSMHHYLEHTRDPHLELDAASKVLGPGGHLLIELPDPESPWGRRLGRWWLPWFQPQHLHLLPIANLCEGLRERDFDIVSIERGEADQPLDLLAAVAFVLEDLLPSPTMPWRPVPNRVTLAARPALFLAATPVLAAALVGDHLAHRLRRPGQPSNTYRVVARRR